MLTDTTFDFQNALLNVEVNIINNINITLFFYCNKLIN